VALCVIALVLYNEDCRYNLFSFDKGIADGGTTAAIPGSG
jgi:hypothetical protein